MLSLSGRKLSRSSKLRAVVLAAGKDFTGLESLGVHCLVPVGQHPLLWYPLNILRRHAFKDVDIICARNSVIEVQEFVDREFAAIRPVLHPLPGEGLNASNRGSLDLLREIHFEVDDWDEVLIVPCDVVFLQHMVVTRAFETHWKHDAAITVVLSRPDLGELIENNVAPVVLPTPGGTKYELALDAAIVDPENERLLKLQSVKTINKDLDIEPFLAKMYPQLEVHTNLRNTHIMIIRGMVMNHLLNQRKWTNLYDEAISHLVSDQGDLRKQAALAEKSSQKKSRRRYQSGGGDGISEFAEVMQASIKQNFLPNTRSEDHDPTFCCIAPVPPSELCWRANSIAALMQAAAAVLSRGDVTDRRHKSVKVPPKTNVGAESIIEPDVQIGERSKVKASVIGRNTVLKPRVKVTNSVVMENVTVEEGTCIHNCIVGRSTSIGKEVDLRDCVVLPHREVKDGTSTSGDTLP